MFGLRHHKQEPEQILYAQSMEVLPEIEIQIYPQAKAVQRVPRLQNFQILPHGALMLGCRTSVRLSIYEVPMESCYAYRHDHVHG